MLSPHLFPGSSIRSRTGLISLSVSLFRILPKKAAVSFTEKPETQHGGPFPNDPRSFHWYRRRKGKSIHPSLQEEGSYAPSFHTNDSTVRASNVSEEFQERVSFFHYLFVALRGWLGVAVDSVRSGFRFFFAVSSSALVRWAILYVRLFAALTMTTFSSVSSFSFIVCYRASSYGTRHLIIP